MLGLVEHKTVETIRNALLGQRARIEELDRRTLVQFWRDWNTAYPLDPKPPHSVCKSDVLSRLGAVRCSLSCRHALAAYERQTPGDLYVLCVDSLIGWRCRCARVPRLHNINANLIVTSADFAWTFGTTRMWRRRCLYGHPVFVEPEMLEYPDGRDLRFFGQPFFAHVRDVLVFPDE